MADGDFFQRIETQMARTRELIEEDRAACKRAVAGHGEALQDIRVELRQMSLRGERLARGYLHVLKDMSATQQDMSDQLRANTQALLAVLDEFKRGGGPAAAGA